MEQNDTAIQFGSPANSYDQCLRSLWEQYMILVRKSEALQEDIIQLKLEKAKLTKNCEYIRRDAERWKKSESHERHLASTMTEKLSAVLSILSKTEVCSDGRTLIEHIQDALQTLDQIHNLPGVEIKALTELEKNTQLQPENTKESHDEQFFF